MKTFQFAAVALATLFTGSTFAAESQKKAPMVSGSIQIKACVKGTSANYSYTTSKVIASGQFTISQDSLAEDVKKWNGEASTLIEMNDGTFYRLGLQYDLNQPNALPTATINLNDKNGYILEALSAKASEGEFTKNVCIGYSQVLHNERSVTLILSKVPLLSQLNLK